MLGYHREVQIQCDTRRAKSLSGNHRRYHFDDFRSCDFYKKLPMQSDLTIRFKAKSFPGFWPKGFLVNTLNPFTVIFRLGIVSTDSMIRGLHDRQIWSLACSVIFTIAVADTIKYFPAKLKRSKIRAKHVSL